jgi:hypothetical protein
MADCRGDWVILVSAARKYVHFNRPRLSGGQTLFHFRTAEQMPFRRPSAHAAQNVHSKEQILASADSGGRSALQHSQLGLSSSTFHNPSWLPRRKRVLTSSAMPRASFGEVQLLRCCRVFQYRTREKSYESKSCSREWHGD